MLHETNALLHCVKFSRSQALTTYTCTNSWSHGPFPVSEIIPVDGSTLPTPLAVVGPKDPWAPEDCPDALSPDVINHHSKLRPTPLLERHTAIPCVRPPSFRPLPYFRPPPLTRKATVTSTNDFCFDESTFRAISKNHFCVEQDPIWIQIVLGF